MFIGDFMEKKEYNKIVKSYAIIKEIIILVKHGGFYVMNKNELIRAIANKVGITLKDADLVLDGVIGAITDGLNDGGKVQISGFGTFELKSKPAREGINPLTKEPLKIPAKTVASFKAGSKLKDALN